MIDAVKNMFWHTGTQLVSELMVPIIALILIMGLFYSAMGMGGRR